MESSIHVTADENIALNCVSAIVVPETAVQEAGYIKMFTVKDGAHAKHEYHAMAQMAYFQYQDEELEIRQTESGITINCGTENIALSCGMVICREREGDFVVLAHSVLNVKKILEAAYRYCTRWVRLDI